jgi:isoleucyl-tRNA synthetase
MSKQKRNYREPQEIFDRYGADALRWYLFANQAPWSSIIYSERAIRESIPEFVLRLWNVYSFFVLYANIDGFDPAQRIAGAAGQLGPPDLAHGDGYRPTSQRGELDRWVLSELNRTAAAVVQCMDAYDNYSACSHIRDFVDALSNWYVRRSRDRFWGCETKSPDKLDAHWTLYECLLATAKLIAPFTPFLAETLWRNLSGVFGDRAVESVHLCDYPLGRSEAVDGQLSQRMRLLRDIASLGRSARMEAKLKVRQPLAKVEVILADPQHQPWLEEHDALLCEELNVKTVEYAREAEQYIDYVVQPNFRRLGPRVGKLMPALKIALLNADGAELMSQLKTRGNIRLKVSKRVIELDGEDVQVRLQAKEGWAAAQGRDCVVVLSTELTPPLVREGYARDIHRLIQERRKQLELEYTDRIAVGIVTDSEELLIAVTENADYIKRETLALHLLLAPLEGVESVEHKVADAAVRICVKRVTA